MAGTIYRRVFYRSIMRAIHKLGWCQMEQMTAIDPGDRPSFWCHWCGMRGQK